jgi:hypothetical protein
MMDVEEGLRWFEVKMRYVDGDEEILFIPRGRFLLT